jgi:hypothetical protein
MNVNEARAKYQADRPRLEALGIILPGVQRYLTEDEKRTSRIAMDALPGPASLDPNSAIPAMLATTIDPEIIRILFSPLEFGSILGERQAGSWVDDVRVFPVIESTGEVSSYGDFANSGMVGVNFNYPAFQSYLFQDIVKYGDREIDRVGLIKVNLVSELGMASAQLLNTYQNLTYAFGVQGLQNYGIMNNPFLSAYLTPAVKAAGGTGWFSGNTPNATANEVYNDVIAVVTGLVGQTNGTLNTKSAMTLAMSPQSEVAMTFTNSFGVSVADLMKKGYPNITVKTAPQYGVQSSTNPQGYSTGGNVMQLIPDKIQGQTIAYCAYNEKLRKHRLISELSSFEQKQTSGSWGTILRAPVAVKGMLGI